MIKFPYITFGSVEFCGNKAPRYVLAIVVFSSTYNTFYTIIYFDIVQISQKKILLNRIAKGA